MYTIFTKIFQDKISIANLSSINTNIKFYFNNIIIKIRIPGMLNKII